MTWKSTYKYQVACLGLNYHWVDSNRLNVPIVCEEGSGVAEGYWEGERIFLLYTIARASITRYHRLGGLNQQTFITHSSEVWKSKIRMPAP